jgi:hypothetical protein
MTRFQWLFVLFLIVTISGCANPSGRAFAGQEIDAVVIFSSLAGEGSGHSPGAEWIADEKGLLSLMDKINRQKIGGSSMPLPAIDYEHEGVLLIRMGRKATGGYGIELASDKVYVRDRTAIVTTRWIEPAKDAVLTQIITSPCLMIKLAKVGYTSIQVVDQKGLVRAETSVEMRQN